MLRQFRGVVSVRECESLARSTQFRAYFCETLFDFREGPLFQLTREDGVRQAVGAHDESPPGQVPCLLPGHRPEAVQLTLHGKSIMHTRTVQTFHEEIVGKLFQSAQFEPRRALAKRFHQLVAPIEPETSPG